MTEPKWKKFEKLAYEVQRQLAPSAQVTFDDHIFGVESQASRQIDISIRTRVGQYDLLIVLECKDHKVPIDVTDMEAFVQKARDVRANKAAMVAASGFTAAATGLAKHHGVETYLLLDAENQQWTPMAIPALLRRTHIKTISLRYERFETLPVEFASPRNVLGLVAFDKEHRPLGAIGQLVMRRCRELDIDSKPGEYANVLLGERLAILHEGVEYHCDLGADITIGNTYYFGPWPIEAAQGFADTQRNLITAKYVRLAPLSPAEIEAGEVPGWERIASPEQLAVKPAVVFGYSDALDNAEA